MDPDRPPPRLSCEAPSPPADLSVLSGEASASDLRRLSERGALFSCLSGRCLSSTGSATGEFVSTGMPFDRLERARIPSKPEQRSKDLFKQLRTENRFAPSWNCSIGILRCAVAHRQVEVNLPDAERFPPRSNLFPLRSSELQPVVGADRKPLKRVPCLACRRPQGASASVSAKQRTEKDFFLRSGPDALLRDLEHARPAWEATHNERAAAETQLGIRHLNEADAGNTAIGEPRQ